MTFGVSSYSNKITVGVIQQVLAVADQSFWRKRSPTVYCDVPLWIDRQQLAGYLRGTVPWQHVSIETGLQSDVGPGLSARSALNGDMSGFAANLRSSNDYATDCDQLRDLTALKLMGVRKRV